MRICFVADGRSPIALSWMRHFVQRGHETHLVSLYPCQPDLQLASLRVIPVAFSRAAGSSPGASSSVRQVARRVFTPRLRTLLRQWMVPLTLPRAARALAAHLEEIRPDIVHAMRLPYEGMLAAQANPRPPLLTSIWGNDFTLHATQTPVLARLTRQAMRRTDALHTDCRRDLRLAPTWDFASDKPAVVLPSGGGVDTRVFYPPTSPDPARDQVVINPRGLRAYVHNASFFRSIPLVQARFPQSRFFCTGMAGEPEPLRWIRQLGIEDALVLLPRLSKAELAAQFRQASVSVSLTTHDGTPNTLLEAMACGCLPVAGDLESIQEWITPGENGLLVSPLEPEPIADAVAGALADPALQNRGAEKNRALIEERADYRRVMPQAEKFYDSLI